VAEAIKVLDLELGRPLEDIPALDVIGRCKRWFVCMERRSGA
jgi:hypothetical protein